MEPEGSLPHSQAPATCPYPEPAQSSPVKYYNVIILWVHSRICGPSLTETSLCGAYLYSVGSTIATSLTVDVSEANTERWLVRV
jgi:hypothetical protein